MSLVKFEIPHRSRHCCLCEKPFEQGMHYFSLLEDDDGSYQRKDYCLPCWEKTRMEAEIPLDQAIYWKSRVPVKKQVPESALRRDEKALQLLKEIAQSDSKEDIAQAFVLALLLVRNKILQQRQEVVQDDGWTVNLYEVMATEEMIAVKKIDLSLIESTKIQSILAEKLQTPHE